jgi:hypothetical protein
MDSLPEWAASVIAVAVGLSPMLAILSARSIARLIHRVPWQDTERTRRRGRKPGGEEPVRVPG